MYVRMGEGKSLFWIQSSGSREAVLKVSQQEGLSTSESLSSEKFQQSPWIQGQFLKEKASEENKII